MLRTISEEKQSLSEYSAVPSMRQCLRESTRLEHESLDRTLAALNLGHAADYVTFLRIQLHALDGLACEWAAGDEEDFAALRDRLAADLGYETTTLPTRSSPEGSSRAASWGIAYVIRGSRLGSKLLKLRVAPGFPTGYFDYAPTLAWPQFLTQLERAAESFDAADRRGVIDAAKFAFASYAAAADRLGATL